MNATEIHTKSVSEILNENFLKQSLPVIIIISTSLLISIILEILQKHFHNSNFYQFLSKFFLLSKNFKNFVDHNSQKSQFYCINALRVISALWILEHHIFDVSERGIIKFYSGKNLNFSLNLEWGQNYLSSDLGQFQY